MNLMVKGNRNFISEFLHWFAQRYLRNPIGGKTIDPSLIRQKDPFAKMKLEELPYHVHQEELSRRYLKTHKDADPSCLSLYFYLYPMALVLGESDENMFFGQKHPMFLKDNDMLFISRCYTAVDVNNPGLGLYAGTDINTATDNIIDQFVKLTY